jgi:hypothetical protein
MDVGLFILAIGDVCKPRSISALTYTCTIVTVVLLVLASYSKLAPEAISPLPSTHTTRVPDLLLFVHRYGEGFALHPHPLTPRMHIYISAF